MNHGENRAETDAEMVREELHRYVEDVRPASDTLPRLLAATRRRRFSRRARRPLGAAVAVAVVATGAFLVALVVVPADRSVPAPVGVAPNSYLAQPRPGVIAAYDLASGERIREVSRVPGRSPSPLAVHGKRVYAVAAERDRSAVVEIMPDGERRTIERAPAGQRITGLAAGAGGVGYLVDHEVVVVGERHSRGITVPRGVEVVDLAVGPRGGVAVLTRSRDSALRATSVRFAAAGATTLTPVLRSECGPLAITWTETGVAALNSVDCRPGTMRIATFDPRSGERVAAGTPFEVGPSDGGVGRIGLSADLLGRYLVSAGGRRWLVDGSHISGVPSKCAGDCVAAPAVLWG
ncbi:hypothetical protein FHX42_002848 [Saccharopolyspora lacisalsi]|uniref:Uncharacterized protein n=1 Tax=Halosaccharopolyspora lacisalsi TaxID=1000566 RepID=A0A839E170_9PSEU|nr:hypothetical protein [Halosaccharopolyspora lacisalsi]MBA8825497.1 hypothetical protein [Halosaccharopolyspora lacisalsi]